MNFIKFLTSFALFLIFLSKLDEELDVACC